MSFITVVKDNQRVDTIIFLLPLKTHQLHKQSGGVRATTAMHAGICFGFPSFAHGGHRVRISCERQNYFFPFKISQLL